MSATSCTPTTLLLLEKEHIRGTEQLWPRSAQELPGTATLLPGIICLQVIA